MKTNQSRAASLRWVEARRREAAMKPDNGLPRSEAAAEVAGLRDEGLSFGAIAKRVGLSKTRVQQLLNIGQ